MKTRTEAERGKRRTLILVGGLALGMFGFGFAMVPLYGLLCEVTGTQSLEERAKVAASNGAQSAGPVDETRWVTVKLDTTIQPDLPWRITPAERKVRVHPGETRRVDFYAENRSGSTITGQALPSIAPFQAGAFFSKLECFCFTRQTLVGNETRTMPLMFTVSPDLPAEIGSLTLSYSVMRVPDSQPIASN
ncbi:MAG: cytochrome c oxidase assembly protein [Chromatiaceae bacterium]